ncbi:MAG: hypothetical protein ACFFE8_14280 [Candidatus Heimdallarchaeota archaeon]
MTTSDVKRWSELPKSVKLLDLSILGSIIILAAAIVLYLGFLDRTIQHVMLIFLTALIVLFTWNFRIQLSKSINQTEKRKYYREWFIICSVSILALLVLIIIYPVTY